MQDKILEIIFDKDDVTWQTMIYELVKTEQMDPWDIDLSVISEKFLEMVRQLKEMDFRISGKVILAAAVLLKIKAVRLVRDDLSEFDKLLIATEEMSEEQFYGDLEEEQKQKQQLPEGEEFKLIPRTPQPRKRKVSVYDLVNALQKALEVKHRRVMREIPEIKVHLPEYHVDISVIITKLFDRIDNYFKKKGKDRLNFNQLVPSDERLDRVMTFIPLLHLTSQRKIDLEQKEHFGEIWITLPMARPTDIELEEEEEEKTGKRKGKNAQPAESNGNKKPTRKKGPSKKQAGYDTTKEPQETEPTKIESTGEPESPLKMGKIDEPGTNPEPESRGQDI